MRCPLSLSLCRLLSAACASFYNENMGGSNSILMSSREWISGLKCCRKQLVIQWFILYDYRPSSTNKTLQLWALRLGAETQVHRAYGLGLWSWIYAFGPLEELTCPSSAIHYSTEMFYYIYRLCQSIYIYLRE